MNKMAKMANMPKMPSHTDESKGVRIISEIGSGTFGKVYRCTYKNKDYVVKKVHISNESFTFKTVQSEFTILSKLKHPRIVSLVHFYQLDRSWNFILEYMCNGTLRHMLKRFVRNRWKFGEFDLLALFMDVLYGVRFLHDNGIIHRDLKPENILIDSNHRLKLADFGISKLVPDQAQAEFHTACGTLAYMAPEVYLHQPYDKSVDTWALGLILYEMAMMTHPITLAVKARILNMKLIFIPPVIDCERRKYRPELQTFLEMMLQRDPKMRRSLQTIGKFPLVAEIYGDLKKEEFEYNLDRKYKCEKLAQ